VAKEVTYKSVPWIFDSRGIMARPATDRPPDQHQYQSMTGCYERSESSISSRYGNQILNRSVTLSGLFSGNFPLSAAPVTLARLLSIGGNSYRYAGLANGELHRRSGTTQGLFTPVASGLSGQPFSTVVTNTQGSSQPFLFCFDRAKLIKDNGTGSPTQTGIFPPTQPVIATQYAPEILLIDSFQSASGYGPVNMSSIGLSTAATVAGTGGTPILGGDYDQYTDTTGSYSTAPDGMIALSENLADGALRLKFNTFPVNNTYDIVALNNRYDAADTFKFQEVTFAIASSTVGYIGKTVALNLSNYQGDDLIVLAIQCSEPQNIQGIQVMFDVNGSDYGASYYWKSIIPVSWQGSVSEPQTNDPVSAMVDAVFDLAMGVTNTAQDVGSSVAEYPTVPTNLQGVQPSQMSSGQGSWSVIYLPKGQFQPAGNAGQSGADWSKITGWRVQVTTNSNGPSNISFNALYIQGSPTSTGIGTGAGASSYGGVGYDFRFTYWDASTLTESNGCPAAYFSVTPTNEGGTSTLIVLRQAINLQLQYSPNPAVTHVRVYARGGVFGNNWYYADQVPNVTGTGVFDYNYILPDEVLEEGNILSLTNDVPVTSTLPNPIATTLSAALNPAPANTNTPTLLTVNVANAGAVFVPYQIVDIGGPQDLEQVYVVTGGTGTFTAYIQLPHALGEPVNVYAAPAQPLYLAALAYGQVWMAGDPNNPNQLYYTPRDQPQYCPPQNHIPVGKLGPSDPITAVINHRGTLFVRTYSSWYQITPGSPPTWQSTGCQHGSPANFDSATTERGVFFQGWDGIRFFVGADADYMSLIIEWLYRDNAQAAVELVNLGELNSVIGAFKNNTFLCSYVGQDGNRHQLKYNTNYKRWRNDDVPATAYLLEPDTNILFYAIPYPNLPSGNWAIVSDQLNQDYDDGGWVNGALAENPIPMNLQLPYLDLGAINNQKQYNVFTVDADPNNQEIGVQLLFDDNNGSVAPINLGTFTGSERAKFQFILNNGQGQEAYKISPVFTAEVTAAPILYQANIEAAILPDQRSSYDSYWQRYGTDESKLVKQAYFDISGDAVNVMVFADGNDADPYWTFTIAANPNRLESPIRERFPALKLRLHRIVMTCVGEYQLWSPIQVDQKPICVGKGYQRSELVEAGPA